MLGALALPNRFAVLSPGLSPINLFRLRTGISSTYRPRKTARQYTRRGVRPSRSASSVSEPLNRMIRCAHIKSKTDHTECFVPVSVTSTVSPGKMNCTVLYRPVQYSHEDCLVYGF